MARTVDATSAPQEKSLSIPEIQAGRHQAAFEAGESVLDVIGSMDQADLDRFMEEELTVSLAEFPQDSGQIGIPLTVVPNVQWAVGGQSQKMKRKYVEVLARARTTVYKQYHNPQNPAESRPIPRTVFSYPFSVEYDPNPKGRAWLENILKQPG